MEEGRKVLLIMTMQCVTLITHIRERDTFHTLMKWLKCIFWDMKKCVQGIAQNGGTKGMNLLIPH